MQRSQHELANRVESAKATDPEGRYDLASKVEVKAYVTREVERIKYDMSLVPALEARIAELELSLWARIKRWFSVRAFPPARKWGGEPLHSNVHAETQGITASVESKTPYFIGKK